MDQFTTEEQQVEAIKKFWKENGTAIILGAVLGFGGLGGWRYYNDSVIAAKEETSDAYVVAVKELGTKEEAFTSAKKFVDENSDTHYAVMAAFKLAKEAVNRTDLMEAERQLQWITDSEARPVLKDIALIRLARVQMEQAKFDIALANLGSVGSASYAALVEEVKGDVFQRQGKFEEAEKAYTEALASNGGSNLLQMKLDDLASQKQG